MNVCLVRPQYGTKFQVNPPLSLGYLSASLKASGIYDVSLLDATLNGLSPEHAAMVPCVRRDLIGIQVYSGSHVWTKRFIECVRKTSPKSRIVVGGPHVTALKRLAMLYLGSDYGVMGEGEAAMAQLAMDVPSGDIKGLMYHDGTDICFGAPVDVPVGIVQPDWGLLHPPNYYPYLEGASFPTRGKRPTVVMTSRGCPYHCTFCASSTVCGRKMRFRSPRSVVDEIKMLRTTYGVDEVFFSDDNITMDMDRAAELFAIMTKELPGLHWRAPNGIRIDRITAGLALLMAGSGCYYVGVGVETGNTGMMSKIKKNLDLGKVDAAVRMLRTFGIATSGFFMCGMLGETREMVEDSIRFACSVPFDRIQVSNYIPYPGSEDFDSVFTDTDSILRFQHSGHIPAHDGMMSLDDAVALQKRFIRSFYMRPSTMWSLAKGMRTSQLRAMLRHPMFGRWVSGTNKWFDSIA